MPVSPDGVLTAEFDPGRALVMLTVDGGMWPSPVAAITMSRQVEGQASEPVRALEERTTVSGGWWLGSDHEVPLDTTVTFTVTGYDAAGAVVKVVSVAVSTSGAAWGLWIKCAGHADWTLRLDWVAVSDRTTGTQGGVYQVHGGGAVGQSAGVTAEAFTVTVHTRTVAETVALRRLLTSAQARTVLLSTGQPEEVPHGWYFIDSHTESNPAQLRADLQALRAFTLPVTRVATPAGGGTAFAGTTYRSIRARHVDYASVLAAGTYADVARGA